MEQILYLTGLGVITFISTNIDDFFITTAFFIDAKYSRNEIVIGKYLGLLLLITISCIGYFFKLVIPIEWIGFMGIMPILIGVRHLILMLKSARKSAKVKSHESSRKEAVLEDRKVLAKESIITKRYIGTSGVLLVILITFSNGGDNIGVYIPLFASLALYELVFIIVVFFAMLGVWTSVAYHFTNNSYISKILKRYGEPSFPFILILLGIYIFIKCGTFSLF